MNLTAPLCAMVLVEEEDQSECKTIGAETDAIVFGLLDRVLSRE